MDENDKLYIIFISVALVVRFRHDILNSDISKTCQIISELTFINKNEITEVLDIADNLKRNLPYSMYISLYKPNSVFIKPFVQKLEAKFSLSIHPREIIQNCYPMSSSCLCLGKCD